MCGIAAIISLRGEVSHSPSIESMTCALKHRGPDGEGYTLFNGQGAQRFIGGPTLPRPENESNRKEESDPISTAASQKSFLALGHRRLSILDTSRAGHQPMQYLNRYHITFSGEIYNYIELKEELARHGYTFASKSDTEVIMAAYDFWGEACLGHFNGMWAFVLFDNENNHVFASRDRFGIQPFYVYQDHARILIASEIKSILACKDVRTAPNDAYCAFFLKTGGDDYRTDTAFQHIFRLAPASFVSFDLAPAQHDVWKAQNYWKLQPTLEKERFSEARALAFAETYRTLLADSLSLRLRADVPVGLALSGGLDSTTLAYLIREILEEKGATEPFETFSSVHHRDHLRAIDESVRINQMAERFNLTSNQIEPQDDEILEAHKKMIRALETPTPSLHMGGWHTYRCAHEKNFKVVIDGQGADELLGGYYIFAANYLGDLPIARLYRGYKELSSIPNLQTKYCLAGLGLNVLRHILGRPIAEKAMTSVLKRAGAKNPLLHVLPLNAALNLSLQTDIVNLLHYGDKLAMSRSVEARHPFLDHKFVEFIASVPAVYKIHAGWTKYIARLAMNKLLPDEIVWRKEKLGWLDPTDFWLDGILREASETSTADVGYKNWLGRLNIGKGEARDDTTRSRLRSFNLSSWFLSFFPTP
ncbi:MAG: asparagine synthase (glutamine-hydrolyzing) [Candidatus Tectomicrobia bacterium]